MRFFTTEGPVNCAKHYCLPPLTRFDLEEILTLISQEKYFLLHAPRQTGKTTCLLALADYLNQQGNYHAIYANIEAAQALREDVAQAMAVIVSDIARWAGLIGDDHAAAGLARQVLADTPHGGALGAFLTRWCQQLDKPLVLLLDEVDALVGDTLISLLRQLRAGYPTRPGAFPQSLILCGVRDLNSAVPTGRGGHNPSSPIGTHDYRAFNIKAKSLRLGDFIRQEADALLAEHTTATGQTITPEALEQIWELTLGQPWLVNALAYETTWEMKEGRDRSRPITAEQVSEAKEALILRRVTHLDQLADKLREPRVRRVVEPMLRGAELEGVATLDDVQYTVDLGLVRRGPSGPQIANPIYREVIPRELTVITQMNFEAVQTQAWHIDPNGRLNLPKLLAAFQHFFRENSEIWLERFAYREAGPPLLMQAFLQRIINGGGRVDREYGLGRRRTDLCVVWNHPGGVQRGVIELKLLHHSLERTLAEGLEQTWRYADTNAAEEAHLIIFDRTPDKAWSEKIWQRTEQHNGMPITVWGM